MAGRSLLKKAFFRSYAGICAFFRRYSRLFRDGIVENGRFKLISFRAYVGAHTPEASACLLPLNLHYNFHEI
jgi:hypothetical protein